jgi:hypothetical protein
MSGLMAGPAWLTLRVHGWSASCYEMSDDRAFAFLVRASSHRNIKLRSVAEELVGEANLRQRATDVPRLGFEPRLCGF